MTLLSKLLFRLTPDADGAGVDAHSDRPPGQRREWVDGVKQGLLIGAVAAGVMLAWPTVRHHFSPVTSALAGAPLANTSTLAMAEPVRLADFKNEPSSVDAQYVANWVTDSRDNGKLPFVIIDKKNTQVFLFDSSGVLMGATPVLMGRAVGDDSVEGIGGRPMNQIRDEEKTTPAGRFVGEPGRNLTGEDVVWVDYHAAVSMHRVRIVDPKERRLERLASPVASERRISYGCVNMPVAFFENVLKPVFDKSYGVVYVLPEVKQVQAVFTTAYDASARRTTVASAN